MRQFLKFYIFPVRNLAALAAALLMLITPAAAQKNKDKKKQQDEQTAADSASQDIRANMPDSQMVDQTISEALGYWQIGDVDSMTRYYSKDIVVVSSGWDQPLIGWDNYAKAYSTQRARLTAAHLDRTNTYIKVNGDSAWATYQWEYKGAIDGQPFDSRGHTTLVLNKQNGHWVIAVDHSSAVSEMVASAPASAAPAQASSFKNP